MFAIFKNRMHFNRKYSKHTSLEIINFKIGSYFGQRIGISKRKINAIMFFCKIIIVHVGDLNRHLWYLLNYYITLLLCCQITDDNGCIETADPGSS